MTQRRLAAAAAIILSSVCALTLKAADPGISLIGMGLVAGTTTDLSGLKGLPICQRDNPAVCIDQALMGGFGSAITYTGHDNVFVAVPDRGPFDGRTDTPFLDRFQLLHMTINVGASFPNITTTLLDTRFLKVGAKSLVGDAYAFNTDNPDATLRFDPEGAALSADGYLYISDEYGPYIYQFNRQGHLVQKIAAPSKFLLREPPFGNPSGDLDAGGNSMELYPAFNTTGRQANRGMEGLALTPNGQWLVGIMQNALLQDHGVNASISRVGFNNRILVVNRFTGEKHEYVYVMDALNSGRGVNDLLALNDHEFLVLERDNRTLAPTPPNASQAPQLKRIYRIDLAKVGLTDVSGVESLPLTGAELATQGIVPVTKTLFLDLLDASYKVDATRAIKDVVAEKVEGLAWGPDLPDGRHVLYVTTDNDLYPGLPTQIYAFAIDAALRGVTIEAPSLPEPFFPPGQVKKALR